MQCAAIDELENRLYFGISLIVLLYTTDNEYCDGSHSNSSNFLYTDRLSYNRYVPVELKDITERNFDIRY